ncbi:DUF5590 domain-containing protein [Periweissella fabaria]|uniref:Cell wall elongation regulator TseB-like domain-containing protein n=1 Tax=Periweissella fabaria TaxID=546157 RepID=A0ABN8BEX5_9LACO|nr:DUF5590 domain-containing protein [Periweissella fabaria]MCM0596773.1 DUF5590 domain-containing protein [Periweissella fabaria]CAH0416301.1 hypothetical protein WFA24289_00603 [Periweissella fabaria]
MQLRQNIYHRKFKIKPSMVIISGLLVILLAIIVIFQIALSPAKRAQNTYEAIAKNNGITKTTSFLVSKRAKVYYSVVGKNKKNQNIAVIMHANDKKFKPVVLKMADGLSEYQIRSLVQQRYNPRKVYSAALTIYEGAPAWDVSYLDQKNNLSFATLQFTNGKQLKLIQNL